MAEKERGTAHIPGIDGLRTVAVLAVIAFHTIPAILRGGFAGVDVFFVISGYVVSGSLWRSQATNLKGFLSQFYARRLLRIYPPLLVCLAATFLFAVLFIPPTFLGGGNESTPVGYAAFFGLSNLVLARQTEGYFSAGTDFNPFVHTWSLGVEEQFYLVFPFILYSLLRGRGKKGLGWTVSRVSLPVLFVASLAYSAITSKGHPSASYFLLLSRFWELAAGALLFFWQKKTEFKFDRADGSSLSLGLGTALIALGLIFADGARFPIPWGVLPVLGTVLAILGISSHGEGARNALLRFYESRVMTGIGKLSYSLYLWHWPVLALMRWTVGVKDPITCSTALTLTFVLAGLSYQFVELPSRRLGGAKRFSHAVLIGGSLAATFLAVAFARGARQFDSHLSLSVTRDLSLWVDRNDDIHENLGADWSGGVGPRVFMIGDSHAMAFYPLMKELAARRNLPIRVDAFRGTPILQILRPMDPKKPEALARLRQTISEARRGDVVFVPGLRIAKLNDKMETTDAAVALEKSRLPEAVKSEELGLKEADEAIGQLEMKGAWVVMDAPKPVFYAPTMRCSDWFNRSNPVCGKGLTIPKGDLLALRQKAMTEMQSLVRRHSNLVVWDTFPTLCPGTECSAFVDGKPLFFDGDHMSVYGNHVLYPEFQGMIDDLIKVPPPADNFDLAPPKFFAHPVSRFGAAGNVR